MQSSITASVPAATPVEIAESVEKEDTMLKNNDERQAQNLSIVMRYLMMLIWNVVERKEYRIMI